MLNICKLSVNPSPYKFNIVNKKDKKKHRGRTKEFWYTPSLVSTKDKTFLSRYFNSKQVAETIFFLWYDQEFFATPGVINT